MSTSIRSFFLDPKPSPTPTPKPTSIRSFFLEQQQEPEDATLMDAYSAFAQGGIGSLKSLTDLAPGFLGGADNPLSSALGNASEYWQGQVSPGRRAELKRQEQEKAALGEDASVLDRVGLYASQMARNPVTTIAEGVGNIVPLAGVGRAARAVGIGAKTASALMGTASGGGSVIGNIYDTTYRSLIKQGVPEEEARARAVEAASYTSAPAEIALGAGMGYLSSRVGADEDIARMVGVEETVAAMRKTAKELSLKGVGKGVVKEAGSEGLEEYEQQRLGNLGAIRAGAQIDPNQGALEAGTKAMVTSMVPGGIATAVSARNAKQMVDAYDRMRAAQAARAAEQPAGLRTGPMPGLDATVPADPAQGQQGAATAPGTPISARDLPEVNRDVYDALIAQGVPEPEAIARAWNVPPAAAPAPPQGAQPPLQGQPPAAAPAPQQAAPAPPQGPPAQPQGDPGADAGLSPFAPFARQYDATTAEAIGRLGIEPPAPVSYLSGALPVAIAEAGAESQLVGGSRLRTLRARFEDAFDKVVSGLTESSEGRPADIPGDTDPVSVGARIKQHAEEFLRKFQRVKEDLYDAATIPREGLPIDVQETKQFLRTVIEEKTAANALDRRAFVGILEALERIPENEDPDAPAPTTAEAYVVRAVIKDLNGRVGAMAGDPNKSGDPVALLKIREMLSQALDSGLAQLDPALGRDLEMANRYYAHAKDNIGLALGQRYSRLVETPEKLVSALLNPGTSLAQLGPLREVLGDETVDDMAAVAVASMIKDSTDPLTGRLTPRGLTKALQKWGGDNGVLSELLSDEQLQKLKDVARVALASERSAKITGGSKTAFLQGLAGGGLVALIANPGLLMGVAAGVVSARASARLMATEGFRTWLTKGFGGRAAFKSGMRTSNRLIDPARVAAAKARLAETARKLGRGTPNMSLIPASPQNLADAAIVGADIFDSGVRDIARWSKRMVKDVGAWVKPHLSDLFAKAKQMLQEREDSDDPSLTADLENVSGLKASVDLAKSKQWATGRDFKVAIQERVLAAAKAAGVDLSKRTVKTAKYLARVGYKDVMAALAEHANAIGWYDEKTRQALAVVSLIHPELKTDSNARTAFIWALAVTSNGQKVDKNFEYAESVYARYKKDGRMPTDLEAGQPGKAMNKGLALFNTLRDEWGMEHLKKFMLTDFTVAEITSIDPSLKPGGEFASTTVRGAAVIGPKIGNGFYSNLHGIFDALTMDRWLVRTFGRWSGTLVTPDQDLIDKASERLEAAIEQLSPEQAQLVSAAVGYDITADDTDLAELAADIQKASADKATRASLEPVKEIRLAGNRLATLIDAQKEAPDGPAERDYIRRIFGEMLAEARKDPRYKDLTMADLQAVLWYAEKRLYESAKTKPPVDTGKKKKKGKTDAYADDSAPDYANAAAKLARSKGVDEGAILRTLRKESNARLATAAQPGSTGAQGQAAVPGQQKAARSFAPQEKRNFLDTLAIRRVRRERSGSATGAESWSYEGEGPRDARGLRSLKNLGVQYSRVWNPSSSLRARLSRGGVVAQKIYELAPTDGSAKRFRELISASKESNKYGAAVYVYPEAEYRKMRLFVTKDGKSGVALKPDGDIVSGFSTPLPKPFASEGATDAERAVASKALRSLKGIERTGKYSDIEDDEKGTGLCSVGAEAVFHALGGKPEGYSYRFLTSRDFGALEDGETHWWVQRGDVVIDPTAAQFNGKSIPYDKGRPGAPPTPKRGEDQQPPSARAKKALDAMGVRGWWSTGDEAPVVADDEDDRVGRVRSLVEAAIAAGGRKADSFDTVLPGIYTAHGMRPIARVQWDDRLAPEGWDKDTFKEFNNGEPDVVAYIYDPSYFAWYKGRKDGKTVPSWATAERIQKREMSRLHRGAKK